MTGKLTRYVPEAQASYLPCSKSRGQEARTFHRDPATAIRVKRLQRAFHHRHKLNLHHLYGTGQDLFL